MNPVIRKPADGRAIAVVGDVYRFLATGEDTDGKYALWEATVPPGGGPPPHVHSREEEGFYVLEGEITFRAGGIHADGRTDGAVRDGSRDEGHTDVRRCTARRRTPLGAVHRDAHRHRVRRRGGLPAGAGAARPVGPGEGGAGRRDRGGRTRA